MALPWPKAVSVTCVPLPLCLLSSAICIAAPSAPFLYNVVAFEMLDAVVASDLNLDADSSRRVQPSLLPLLHQHLRRLSLHLSLRYATPERKEKQSLSLKDWSVLVVQLLDQERLLGRLDELHLGASSPLEAEEDDRIRIKFEKVLECLHQQGEGGFEVDALCCNNDVGS